MWAIGPDEGIAAARAPYPIPDRDAAGARDDGAKSLEECQVADGARVLVPRSDHELVVLDVVEGIGEVDAGEPLAEGRRPDQLIQGGLFPFTSVLGRRTTDNGAPSRLAPSAQPEKEPSSRSLWNGRSFAENSSGGASAEMPDRRIASRT